MEAVSISTHGYTLTQHLVVEGQPVTSPDDRPLREPILINATSSALARVMGLRLIRGQWLVDNEPTAAINERLSAREFPGQDPIGRRIRLDENAPFLTIVGIVDDVKQMGPSGKSHPAIYQPYLQVHQRFLLSHMTYVIRTGSDPLGAVPSIRAVLRAVDKDQPAISVGLMSDTLDAATAEPEFNATLLGAFALLAVILALVGTYGVIAYSVAQRQHEIGLRMALGARATVVMWLVIRRTLILGAAGVIIGAAAAWFVTRLLETFLFEISPGDPATFTVVAGSVFAAALLAGVIPACRAARVDPLVALRHE